MVARTTATVQNYTVRNYTVKFCADTHQVHHIMCKYVYIKICCALCVLQNISSVKEKYGSLLHGGNFDQGFILKWLLGGGIFYLAHTTTFKLCCQNGCVHMRIAPLMKFAVSSMWQKLYEEFLGGETNMK